MKLDGNILAYDSNKGLLTALSLQIGKHFRSVDSVQNLKEISDTLKQKQIDVVVLDLDQNSAQQGREFVNLIKEIGEMEQDTQVVVIVNFSQNIFAQECIEAGAFDYLTKPWNNEKLQITLRNAYLMRQNRIAIKQINSFKKAFYNKETFFWGIGDVTKHLLNDAQKGSNYSKPLLLSGGKGTGKELLARQIHNLSARREGLFVKINAAEVSDAEFERTLTIADGGTVYIEDIELLNDTKVELLLSIANNKIFYSLNNITPSSADIKIITGSTMDFAQLKRENLLNEELLGYLRKCNITIPSLNERREDILPLAQAFLKKYCKKYGKSITGFTELCKETLTNYNWQGNTSELSITIERAVIHTENGKMIEPGTILLSPQSDSMDKQSINNLTLEQMEIKMIRAALKKGNNNITLAAQQLGITRQTLYNKGKKYKLLK